MNPHTKNFLESFFKAVDCAGISYCVSRNADQTFAETDSDVDLVVDPRDVASMAEACIKCARENGFELALRTQFANLCLLFWAAPAEFIRIDVDNSIRWRIFPVIAASKLLREKRRSGLLFVPSALGEALVLTCSVACRGRLSERYRDRLNVLWGDLSPEIASAHSGEPLELIAMARAGDIRRLKKRLITRALEIPGLWPAVVHALISDVVRIVGRVAIPPGYYLSFTGAEALDLDCLAKHLNLAFPTQKNYCFEHRPSPIRIFLSLFRGGLVLERRLDTGDMLNRVARFPFRWLCSRVNRITAFWPGNGHFYILHEDSGLMAEHESLVGAAESQVASFIGRAMTLNNRSSARRSKGKFIVLVGLDGAGKTTFARSLCGRLAVDNMFARVRYYHWIPTLIRRTFPWPSFAETPRKKPSVGITHLVSSILRLLKNIIHVWWVYLAGIRWWISSGDVVLVDRFIYNYWLDPVSLRYCGPKWLLFLTSHIIPRPDLVFSLETDAETLLSRKRELTRAEIEQQAVLLACLPLNGTRKVVIDASLTPAEMVDMALKELQQVGKGP